ADALEALDSLAPKPVARELLELLEPSPAAQAAKPFAVGPALNSLAHHPKPWVRACTALYLGHHENLATQGGGNGNGRLSELLNDRDAIVRETALYAGWKAFHEKWARQVESAARSPEPILHRCAERIKREMGEDGASPNDPRKRGEPMLLTVEKVLFLKSAPVFSALEGEELAAVADIALEQDYAAGESIFEEGQLAHHLYVLVTGKVEVFRKVGEKEYPLALLGARECFGEMAILDDEPRSASIRALEPATVLKVDRESFRELVHERPQISFAIFKMLSQRLRSRNMEVETLPAIETVHTLA
ncbi:MAG TPA: cyclic nucleotide-binding domain-containing protein, partial [Terriglobia bacterium]|nr:cyclic nucleotide-binding domain-containing protein [Terriglobia bacterium]